MKKDAITFTQLCARLERAIHCDVGMEGLETLLFGWRVKTGMVNNQLLFTRKKADGEKWLSLPEAYSFSRYAGYDLTRD